MKEYLMIDLCSGLGGASEPFLMNNWNVIRIDNDPMYDCIPRTEIKTMREFKKELLNGRPLNPVFVWASPPCHAFSCASAPHYWVRNPANKEILYPSPEVREPLKLVFDCLEVIDILKPRWHILENPRGMLRKVLGFPDYQTSFDSWGETVYKPTDLWGKIPNIIWPDRKKSKKRAGVQLQKKGPIRAKIPYNLCNTIRIEIERSLINMDSR